MYLIYGIFLYGNPTEALFHEGGATCNSNVLMYPAGSAVHLQPHNAMLESVDFFYNTTVVRDTGIRIASGNATKCQCIWRNMEFAAPRLKNGEQIANAHGICDETVPHLARPFCTLCVLYLALKRDRPGAPLMPEFLAAAYPDAGFDFDGHRRMLPVAGAYVAARPDWQLALAHKSLPLPRR